MQTQRQEIVEALEYGHTSARDLAKKMNMRVKDLLDDLEHIRASKGRLLVISEAYCTRCDFIFKRRKKLSTPSRCPECRSERTAGPFFKLKHAD